MRDARTWAGKWVSTWGTSIEGIWRRAGFLAPAQVRFNVQAALEGLGLAPSDSRQTEEALQRVHGILQPVMNTTWPSGRPENN